MKRKNGARRSIWRIIPLEIKLEKSMDSSGQLKTPLRAQLMAGRAVSSKAKRSEWYWWEFEKEESQTGRVASKIGLLFLLRKKSKEDVLD